MSRKDIKKLLTEKFADKNSLNESWTNFSQNTAGKQNNKLIQVVFSSALLCTLALALFAIDYNRKKSEALKIYSQLEYSIDFRNLYDNPEFSDYIVGN